MRRSKYESNLHLEYFPRAGRLAGRNGAGREWRRTRRCPASAGTTEPVSAATKNWLNFANKCRWKYAKLAKMYGANLAMRKAGHRPQQHPSSIQNVWKDHWIESVLVSVLASVLAKIV